MPSAKTLTSLKDSITYSYTDYGASLHVSIYHRHKYSVMPVVFGRPTLLYQWCIDNEIQHAFGGGFFDRQRSRPLGELWLDGKPQNFTYYDSRWHQERGAIATARDGSLQIDALKRINRRSTSSLVQAGPVLVSKRCNLIRNLGDQEGFSAGAAQFDSDITKGPYPRAAIGFNNRFIFFVAADGYTSGSRGITFADLADVFIDLEADSALNLDGGGSATMIYEQRLINKPRTVDYEYRFGREIYSSFIIKSKTSP